MNIDILVQYCVYNDYPIWRRMIKDYRSLFNKVILYPSRHHGYIDLEDFSKRVFPETWADPVEIDYGVEDWRQAEVTPLLDYSDSEWVWFTEQDFFVDDWDKFYADIEEAMKTNDMIGWWQESQKFMHPCCLFIKRELLNKTDKDFSAHPETKNSDHFAMITRDAERLGAKILKLQDIGYTNWENAYHLAGLTYPAQDFKGDNTIFGVGNLEAFYVYNYFSRRADVEQSELYMQLSVAIEKVMEKKHKVSIDPETSKWAKFYE